MRTESTLSWVTLALVAVLCVGLLQLAILAPELPERVASHFDLRGEVDGWMERRAFLVVFAFLELFLTALFFGLGVMVRSISVRHINLPHRDWWLAPERERGTRLALARDLGLLGVATVLLMQFAVHECYRASTGREDGVPSVNTVLIVYAALVLLWLVWLYQRHARVPSHGR